MAKFIHRDLFNDSLDRRKTSHRVLSYIRKTHLEMKYLRHRIKSGVT
jgi:hypothetical protein